MVDFSVLMPVYKNDKPADFRVAVESISVKQTVKPKEILIVVDGPVPDVLRETIQQVGRDIQGVKVEWCAVNQGLGLALQYGMERVSNEIVARMDSDDIALPDRFEKQLARFEQDSELGVLGGYIAEFIDTPDNIVGRRIVPTQHKDICKYLKKRDAFNHMTVMFRKSEVMKAGNYQHWYLNEDSYLWSRMLLAGCKFENLPDILVLARVGKDMYARRGGWKLFKSELKLQNFRLKKRIIGLPLYLFNVSVRFVVQILLPNKLRSIVFQRLFRE